MPHFLAIVNQIVPRIPAKENCVFAYSLHHFSKLPGFKNISSLKCLGIQALGLNLWSCLGPR